MKTYVLYHGPGCLDGFGAAFAAWLRFGDKAEYIPVTYGPPPPPMLPGAPVYILDFSYPAAVLRELAEKHTIVVLDHHATAQADLLPLSKELKSPHLIKFDMAKSGAVLTWEHFHSGHPSGVPEFFLYLQDRDLWQFKLPMSREVSMALRSYPMDFQGWSDLTAIVVRGWIYELPGIRIDELKKEGVSCRRLTEQQVDIMAKGFRFVEFRDCCDSSWSLEWSKATGWAQTEFGYIVPVANTTVFFSEVGERLLELHPDAKFSAYYMDRKDGKRQWGLRSRPNFDCSVIAKHFGGGGHKQAAGFVTDVPNP